MSHFSKPIRFIDQFLTHFQPLFSQTQMKVFRQMIYAMFFDYKRLNLSSIAKRTHTSIIKNSNISLANQTGASINLTMSA